ncbi:response regulator, partial [uncultured Phocaeicola sp.]|uniref:response regulator n=1 Tax=uncultured Phocaeicola sp. TaxID=990718 RepID=UPI0025ADCE7C
MSFYHSLHFTFAFGLYKGHYTYPMVAQFSTGILAHFSISIYRLLEELDDGDIIVSDLRLPDGECTEVLERMRETGIRNPFVIMTDYAQVASAVSSMRLGAEDYIPKNLLQEKLLPRISELVRKS